MYWLVPVQRGLMHFFDTINELWTMQQAQYGEISFCSRPVMTKCLAANPDWRKNSTFNPNGFMMLLTGFSRMFDLHELLWGRDCRAGLRFLHRLLCGLKKRCFKVWEEKWKTNPAFWGLNGFLNFCFPNPRPLQGREQNQIVETSERKLYYFLNKTKQVGTGL